MSDKFFTLMLVPERSGRIRKLTIPSIYIQVSLVVGTILCFLAFFMLFDYFHMLSQVAENKNLKKENHLLKQNIQESRAKLETLDQSVSRLKAFSQKIRILGNLDQPGITRMLQAPSEGGKSSAPSYDEDGGSIESLGSPSVGTPKIENSKKKVLKTEEQPEFNEAPATVNPNNLHSQLEYDRSLSLQGEFGSFDTASLIEQIDTISLASEKLTKVVQAEEENFARLYEDIKDEVEQFLHTPSILPTQGWISSPFGSRHNPFIGTRTFHAGIDIANRIGTSVYAPATGVVTYAGYHGGFGLVVQVDHGFGIVTKYGHNSRVFVKAGDHVSRGIKISEMGSSGRSTGPHLHYQVEIKGKPVNPMLFILEE